MGKPDKRFLLRWSRRIIQAVFLLYILQLAVRAFWTQEENLITSAEALCPLGGLETLYIFITKGVTISHVHVSNLFLFLAIILIAFIARNAFCGWICPFGTIQEWIRKIGKHFSLRIPLFFTKRFSKWKRLLTYIKYVVLLWIIVETIRLGTMIFRDYDPFVRILKISEIEWTVGMFLLLSTLVLSLFVERPWCRYFCPLGAALGIFNKFSLIKLKRDPDACKSCNLCTKACPVNIQITEKTTISDASCISCLQCVDSCPTNALQLKTINPLRRKAERKEVSHHENS